MQSTVFTVIPPPQTHLAHTVTRDNVNMGRETQIRSMNQGYPTRITSRRSQNASDGRHINTGSKRSGVAGDRVEVSNVHVASMRSCYA